MKGFAKLVIGLLAAILGILLGIWFYGTAGAFLRPYVSHEDVANFLGFMAIFLGVLLIRCARPENCSACFSSGWASPGWTALLGAVFGLLRGLVFAIALILALMAFSPQSAAALGSAFAPGALCDRRRAHLRLHGSPPDARSRQGKL